MSAIAIDTAHVERIGKRNHRVTIEPTSTPGRVWLEIDVPSIGLRLSWDLGADKAEDLGRLFAGAAKAARK